MKWAAVRIAVIVLAGIALAIGVMAYKAGERDRLGRQLRGEFRDDLARAGLDEPGRQYAQGLADEFHREAFEASFGADAPAIGGTADEAAYQRDLIGLMIARATADGKEAVAAALAEFRDSGSRLDHSGTR